MPRFQEMYRYFARARNAPFLLLLVVTVLLAVGLVGSKPGETTLSHAELVQYGRQLFFEETFDGNGRTCATCHRPENGFALSAELIATLPPNDPLFVFETNPQLNSLEDGQMLHERGLILANADGYDQPHVFRSVPSIINVAFTAPYGWSGEFATLQAFARNAVKQHFTKSLKRRPGIDFRFPAEEELEALAAFMKSVTSGHDRMVIENPTPETLAPLLETEQQRYGMDLFFSDAECSACHSGPALAFPDPDGPFADHLPFFDNRGKGLKGKNVLSVNRKVGLPADDGDGEGRFNTANLLGLSPGPGFFHDDAVTTLRDVVEAYTSDLFANSPPGRKLGGIDLEEAEIDAIAAFLRAINNPETPAVDTDDAGCGLSC